MPHKVLPHGEARIASGPSILFIDAYDSFTNSIISLLTTTLDCSIRVLHIDSPGFESEESLRNELKCYDAVVCGPGPGNPKNDKDVGLMKRLWKLQDEDIIPVLGICLGFQSLALEFGADVKRLNQGLHGLVKRVRYLGEDSAAQTGIFEGVGEVRATLYQSLCADIGQDLIPDDRWAEEKWLPSKSSPDLQPLAWVEQDEEDSKDARILVAVQHRTKPFWALQYHPESICTNPESTKVVRNWLVAAMCWNKENGREISHDGGNSRGEHPTRRSLLADVELRNKSNAACHNHEWRNMALGNHYDSRVMDLQVHIGVPEIVEALELNGRDQILFESSNAHVDNVGSAKVKGRYSIIALEVDDALRVEYQVGENFTTIRRGGIQEASQTLSNQIPLEDYGGIWQFLADFLEKRLVLNGSTETPFWGGFMGYSTYELGLEGIGVETSNKSSAGRPDLNFAWITRSIVVDHQEKKIHIQELASTENSEWLDTTILHLKQVLRPSKYYTNNSSVYRDKAYVSEGGLLEFCLSKENIRGFLPPKKDYEAKVEKCQESIRNGDSYEICLTDQSKITFPARGSGLSQLASTSAWPLYRKLRHRQPAPFSSFIRLGSATFVSCSPERFLKWDAGGKCELRPMKGTVKKSPQVSTLAQAEALLQIPKEQAENLMIVDLVRHDLHSVCGPGNVTVPRLMVVEEYATVFQMITVVQGQIPQLPGNDSNEQSSQDAIIFKKTRRTGIDVLAASLPPGSMTGAPKKRSCELLQEIEDQQPRSLYSGVVGYMDVGGRGDFSVNIRCAFRWDDEVFHDNTDNHYEAQTQPEISSQDTPRFTARNGELGCEVWHIGAGGAVTALSTPVGEREEMQTKLGATLCVFGLSV